MHDTRVALRLVAMLLFGLRCSARDRGPLSPSVAFSQTKKKKRNDMSSAEGGLHHIDAHMLGGARRTRILFDRGARAVARVAGPMQRGQPGAYAAPATLSHTLAARDSRTRHTS